ncbi:MAG: sigma-70 family RNA polymerase sigma factor [Chloroflexi bacterium]|jgi:RNA polymerase sigma factor (sigma-70 family)|nr:sigma-70 family RNA polymerase sigma factor [Anaerolineaceae bacterium]NMB87449.1 sigma-70 family RNA polymerase sigma factor [Chloroflexota bacterium]
MSELILLDVDQSRRMDEDEKLVLAAQHNPAEFKPLYLKWLKQVYRYFYFRVGNARDAEDLTSQVFLKAYEDLPRYRSRGCFSAWLFSIAHARAVDFYRRGTREVSLEELSLTGVSPDLLSQAAHNLEIQEMLARVRSLPEEEQELIRLRFMGELSYREIGLVLHRSEEAVRKSISRLLDRLQSQLEVHDDEIL